MTSHRWSFRRLNRPASYSLVCAFISFPVVLTVGVLFLYLSGGSSVGYVGIGGLVFAMFFLYAGLGVTLVSGLGIILGVWGVLLPTRSNAATFALLVNFMFVFVPFMILLMTYLRES